MLNLKISVKSLTTPESVGVSCEDLSLEFNFSVKDLCDPEYMAVLCAHVQNLLDKPQIKQIIEAVLKDAGIDLPPVVNIPTKNEWESHKNDLTSEPVEPHIQELIDIYNTEEIDAFKAKYFPNGIPEGSRDNHEIRQYRVVLKHSQNIARYGSVAPSPGAGTEVCFCSKEGTHCLYFNKWVGYVLLQNPDLGWTLVTNQKIRDTIAEAKQQSGLSSPSTDFFKLHWPEGMNATDGSYLNTIQKAFNAGDLHPINAGYETQQKELGAVIPMTNLTMHRFEVTLYFTKCYAYFLLTHPELGWKLVKQQNEAPSLRVTHTCSKCGSEFFMPEKETACPHCGHL